jgi:hypothetical protein
MKTVMKIGSLRCAWILTAGVVAMLAATAVRAGVVTYNITGDTYVDSATANTGKNYGASSSLRVLVNGSDSSLCHGLIQMPSDMLSIPAGDVTNVTLYMSINQNHLTDSPVSLPKTVRLFPLTAGFIAGTGTSGGTAPSDGGDTWTSTAGGSYGQADYVDAASNTVSSGGWFSWDITGLWNNPTLRNDLLNFGAMLTLDNESTAGIGTNMPRAVFYTSESAGGHPYFSVTTVPEPASLAMLLAGGWLVAAFALRRRLKRDRVGSGG